MSDPARENAAITASSLLRQPRFWLRQPLFVATVILACVATVMLAPFTYGVASGTDVVLLLFVHALAVGAAAISARAIAVLEIETAIVQEIDRKGAELLRDVRSGQRARVDIDALEQAVVPKNPSDPAPAMVRLFQHICKEAKDRRFESSVNVMQPYREEQLEVIFRLQNLQKIVLWLGILGTFIGLLMAIAAAEVHKGDFLRIVQQMFAGLAVAFSASLAGLQVAVLIGVLLLLIRRSQTRYFKLMEAAVVTMLSLARNSINKDEFMAEFGQIASTIEDLTARVRVQTSETVRSIEDTRRDVAGQTEAIREGLGKLAEAGEGFDGFLKNLSTNQAQFIEEVRGVYDTISLRELSATLHESLLQAGRTMSDAISMSTRQIANQLNDFNVAVDQLNVSLEHQGQASAEYAKKLAAQISASTTESATAIRTVVARLHEMGSREQSIRGELQELARTVAMLSNSINRLDGTPVRRGRGLRDFLTSFRS